MTLCCATLHITVRSCNEEGPVEGAEVYVSKPGETEGSIVTVAGGVTDDTGTLTFLVDDAGTYFLHSEYNGGEADKTVEAECGINNVDILFAATDKICVRLSPETYVGPAIGVSASKDGSLVDSCSLGTGVKRCCLNIPGPGTYTLSSDEILATIEPPEIEVKEEDCGDKIATLTVPVPGETCERTINLWLCGCPAQGFPINVTMPSGRVLSASTDEDGVATFLVPIEECGDWVGSTYSVDLPGTTTNLTGTVTGDGMTIAEIDPPGTWCEGHNEPCFGAGPDTITGVFSSGFGGTLVAGSTTTLSKTGVYTWESPCLPYTTGFSNVWIKLTLTLDPEVIGCTPNYSGQIVQGQFGDAGCGFPITAGFYTMDGPSSSMCPVYGAFSNTAGRVIEIFP